MRLIDPEIAISLQKAAEIEGFGLALLEKAQGLARVDEIFGFVQRTGERPISFASSSALDGADDRANLYATRFHHFDPVTFERAKTPIGQGSATVILANDIALSDYRQLCFDMPAFKAKYFFGWHSAEGWYVINFYARILNREEERQALLQLSGYGLSIMMSHTLPLATGIDAIATYETRLGRVAPELTPREQQVCARTLAGLDARAIESDLGIGINTVRTYRQRAYRRYGISSANEFLPYVISNRLFS
ncbi:helix-turn-helix transcriptional regulator [Blastomonas sp. AAP53]|uniref:response regulator transcription factor n=1 Tax=Blastomonas sp. AAP53 TaxID=1248760 RepID=UPI00031B2283|nr:helix-turn-helix transcriptional regulator [Blastomonas sp. AAP53]